MTVTGTTITGLRRWLETVFEPAQFQLLVSNATALHNGIIAKTLMSACMGNVCGRRFAKTFHETRSKHIPELQIITYSIPFPRFEWSCIQFQPMSVSAPDITVLVDWALSIKLPTSLSVSVSVVCLSLSLCLCLKKAYNMSLGLHEKGYVTWVTRIKTVLCNNGFEQVWLFGCGQEGPFFKELRERLYSSFCHGW